MLSGEQVNLQVVMMLTTNMIERTVAAREQPRLSFVCRDRALHPPQAPLGIVVNLVRAMQDKRSAAGRSLSYDCRIFCYNQ